LDEHQDITGDSRELRLRLIKVRAEATAARLEARAAELELMLLTNHSDARLASADGQTATTADTGSPLATNRIDGSRSLGSEPADALIAAIRRVVHPAGAVTSPRSQRSVERAANDLAPLASEGWDGFLAGLREPEVGQAAPVASASASDVLRTDRPNRGRGSDERRGAAGPIVAVSRPETAPTVVPTVLIPNADPASIAGSVGNAVSHAEADSSAVSKSAEPKSAVSDGVDRQSNVAKSRSDSPAGKFSAKVAPTSDGGFGLGLKAVGHHRPQTGLKSLEVTCPEGGDADLDAKRLRPAGWVVSTAAHVVILLLLGLMTLSAPKPRDQLSFAGSTAEAAEPTVESFTIEAFDAVPEDSQPAPAETALDISPVGEIAVSEVSLDLPAAPQTSMPNDLLSDRPSGMTSLASAASGGGSPMKVQFAGIDGGGSHFVYLVDSSNSMKNFNEARMELLRSVDSLQPDQRFYVVFYDQDPSYMRISDPQADEEASVRATPANKLALRRWAMAVRQDKGLSPVDVLRFSFELRPDVIFLLSDGQFSEKTEAVIKERNLQENLFGESGPISIIHTIRYPGYQTGEAQKAEVQMRRIAEANGGQYRNVVLD
jgi:hypothetical protein